MNVICFGDSNTYGYDPRSWLGGWASVSPMPGTGTSLWAYDGVHFTEQGHRAFAAGLLEILR